MGMMNRRPKYNQGVPIEEIPEVLGEFTALVLAICGCFAVPLLLLGLASQADSTPCATLSDKSDTICLERLN